MTSRGGSVRVCAVSTLKGGYPWGYIDIDLDFDFEIESGSETRRNQMCSPITSSACGKITWSGCGQHVEQVMANVPAERRCQGHGDGSFGDQLFATMFGKA